MNPEKSLKSVHCAETKVFFAELCSSEEWSVKPRFRAGFPSESERVQSYLALDVDLVEGCRPGGLKEPSGFSRQEDGLVIALNQKCLAAFVFTDEGHSFGIGLKRKLLGDEA